MIVEIIIKLFFLILFVLVASSILFGAPYVVSDKNTLGKILKLIGNIKGKKVVDLGSGDGRLVVEFAKRGAFAFGYEINPVLVAISLLRIYFSRKNITARIYLGNYWTKDLSNYNVIVVFGISYMMLKLESKLKRELKKGTIVVSVSYKFPNLVPEKSLNGVYLYKI